MPKHRFHPDELALLAATHAEPRSDEPRLIYAAWLDRHDQPELAEFILLHIRLAAENPRGDPIDTKHRLYGDSERLRRVAVDYRRTWLRRIPPDLASVASYYQDGYHKGLSHLAIRCHWPQWQRAFDRLEGWLNPRCQVGLNLFVTAGSNLAPTLAHPLMERVAWLHILGDEDPNQFPEPKSSWQIRRLPLTTTQIEAIADFPHFARLHRLVFSELTPEGEKIASTRIVPHVPTSVYGRKLS